MDRLPCDILLLIANKLGDKDYIQFAKITKKILKCLNEGPRIVNATNVKNILREKWENMEKNRQDSLTFKKGMSYVVIKDGAYLRGQMSMGPGATSGCGLDLQKGDVIKCIAETYNTSSFQTGYLFGVPDNKKQDYRHCYNLIFKPLDVKKSFRGDGPPDPAYLMEINDRIENFDDIQEYIDAAAVVTKRRKVGSSKKRFSSIKKRRTQPCTIQKRRTKKSSAKKSSYNKRRSNTRKK